MMKRRNQTDPKPWPLSPWPTVLLLLLLVGGGTACSTLSTASANRIAYLHLLVPPTALDLDLRPGADAVAVKLFATSPRSPRPVPIQRGTIEFLAYEGTPYQIQTNQPFHRWTFTASQLRTYQIQTAIGPGYELILSWGRKVIRSRFLTILARYHTPNGKIITSPPSTLQAITAPAHPLLPPSSHPSTPHKPPSSPQQNAKKKSSS